MIQDKSMIKYVNESASLHQDAHHRSTSDRSCCRRDVPFVNFLLNLASSELAILCRIYVIYSPEGNDIPCDPRPGWLPWNPALWLLFNPIFIAFLVELKTRPLVFFYHLPLFSCLEGQELTAIRMDWVCQVSVVGQVSCWLLNTLRQVF